MQKIFSIETYLSPLLMRYIGKYVKLRDDQFQLSLWGGDAVLNYVELQYDIFEDLMPLPVGFKSGHIHELRIQVPWTRLGSSSIVITLNTVECVLAFKRPDHNSKPSKRNSALNANPSRDVLPTTDSPTPPSYLQSYLSRILANIEVVVNNLIVKFVEDDAVISLNIRTLDCFPTLTNWERGLDSQAPSGNFCLHRLLRLTDMTLCVDQSAANGHISAYQDPVVYRSSFTIRLQTVFTPNATGLASICVANLFSPDVIEINLSQVQLPLLARILEILVALANESIKWDALSASQVITRSQTQVEKPNKSGDLPDEAGDDGLSPSQSWSQWAWSFVPSLPTFVSNPVDEDLDDINLDEASIQYLENLKACEARAEYLKYLYEDAQAPLGDASQSAQLRRGFLSRLRRHQKAVPALILGVLMKKIQVNIKTSHRKTQPDSHNSPSSSTKNLKRSDTTHDLFSITLENLALQIVQDSNYFVSLRAGLGLLKISPVGSICPCGRVYSQASLPDLLEINRKSQPRGEDDQIEVLINSFCGLFAEPSKVSENQSGVIDVQPSRGDALQLPPFCRRAYLSRYTDDFRQLKAPLAMWFESVSSREAEEEPLEENPESTQEPRMYSFNRCLFDNVDVGFSLGVSHRLQHFLQILAEGSRHYAACLDWDSLEVLPKEEPVDSWLLQERMVHLRQFTPRVVTHTQILGLSIKVFPPTHDPQVAERFPALKIEVGTIDALMTAPLKSAQLVSTMTHLYPSSGVLDEVNASFQPGSVVSHKTLLQSKQWGQRDQILACFGTYEAPKDPWDEEGSKGVVFFGFEEENPITKSLQIDLLNGCYKRAFVQVNQLRVSLSSGGHVVSPISFRLVQRALLFQKSWPKHLADEMVLKESHLQMFEQMRVDLYPSTISSLVGHGIYFVSEADAMLEGLSYYYKSEMPPESVAYSSQLCDDSLDRFFNQNSGLFSFKLEACGFASLCTQSKRTQNTHTLHFESSNLTGYLVNCNDDTSFVPVFECRKIESGSLFSYKMEMAYLPSMANLCPSSLGLQVAPIKLLISSSLVTWLMRTSESIKKTLEIFEIDRTQESPKTSRSGDDPFISSLSNPFEVDFNLDCLLGDTSFRRLSANTTAPSGVAHVNPDRMSTQSKPNASVDSTFLLINPSNARPPDCSPTPTSALSLWIADNYKWFTLCKVEILISSPSIYFANVPTDHCSPHYAIDSWLTSTDHSQVACVTLPQIQVSGPTSHGNAPPLRRVVPPPSPRLAAPDYILGIRLYSFELEEERAKAEAEEAKRRLRRIRSSPEPDSKLNPCKPMWQGRATGLAVCDGAGKSQILGLDVEKFSLSFSVEKKGEGEEEGAMGLEKGEDNVTRIAWNLDLKLADSTKEGNEVPSLRGTLQLLAVVSSISGGVVKVSNEVNVVNRLLARCLRTSRSPSPASNAVPPASPSLVGMKVPSTKASSSIVSHVTFASSYSLSEAHKTPNFGAPARDTTTTAHPPVHGQIQVSLPSGKWRLGLTDQQALLVCEVENLKSVFHMSDTPFFMHYRLQLERICFFLSVTDRCFPLLSSKHWYLRPFQNVSQCPGTEILDATKAVGSRPKPQENDSDTETEVTPSHQPQRVSKTFLTVCLTCAPSSVIQSVFGGRRFAFWLDRAAEQALVGDKPIECNVITSSPPFVNCLYARMRPMDVVACPQLTKHLTEVANEILGSGVEEDERKEVVRATRPGHTMPLIFVALDELRAFIPSPGLLAPLKESTIECDTVVLSLDALRFHPFPTNCITARPEVPTRTSKSIRLTNQIGSPREDRQFALRLNGIACSAVNLLKALNLSGSDRRIDDQPTLAGQYPAFEWNQAATRLSDVEDAVWVLPVLRPFSLTAIYAAPVCETNLVCGQSRSMYGSALEVNISQDIIVTLNIPFAFKFLSHLGGASHAERKRSTVSRAAEPFQLLVTCGLVRLVVWTKGPSTENQWDLAEFDVVQPHLWWSPNALNAGLNDFQVYIRTFSDQSDLSRGDVIWTLTLPRNEHYLDGLPRRLILSQVSEVIPARRVKHAFCSTSGESELLAFNVSQSTEKGEKRFEASLSIQRDVTIVLTPNMLRCMENMLSFARPFTSPVHSQPSTQVEERSESLTLLNSLETKCGQLHFKTQLFFVRLLTEDVEFHLSIDCVRLEGRANSRKDWRSFDTALQVTHMEARLNDLAILPTGMEISGRSFTEFSSASLPRTVATLELSRGARVVLPLGGELSHLLSSFSKISNVIPSSKTGAKRTTSYPRTRATFTDDLRQKETYDFSVFVPTGPTGLGDVSRWLPLPYEIVFADCDQFALEKGEEVGERCATMLWTFPEPRQPTRLVVNPVPFVYDEDDGRTGGFALPACLQYWSDCAGEFGGFVTYATFDLREDAAVEVVLPPVVDFNSAEAAETLDLIQRLRLVPRAPFSSTREEICWGSNSDLSSTTPLPVSASSWRIIVTCVSRSSDFQAVPVFISPYALAACVQLDSIYVPELTSPLSLRLSLQDFSLSTWQQSPSSIETGRLTISKLGSVLATDTASVVRMSAALDSLSVHLFSPHGANLQLLAELQRVYGVTGNSLSVGLCQICCSSDLLYALNCIALGGGGQMGWQVRNSLETPVCVEQCFSGTQGEEEPAAAALNDVTSVRVQPGHYSSSWRPIVLPEARHISLRVGLTNNSDSVRWSKPISVPWAPIHNTKGVYMHSVDWEDSSEDASIFLVIPSRASSGIPGEIIIQPGLEIKNSLPVGLSVQMSGGKTVQIPSNSSSGLSVPLSRTSTGFSLSISGHNAFVKLSKEEMSAPNGKIFWLPTTNLELPVLLKPVGSLRSVGQEEIAVVEMSPVIRITSAFPIPLTLSLPSEGETAKSFLVSKDGATVGRVEVTQESTTPVTIALQRNKPPLLTFHYPDGRAVFESPLALPWSSVSKPLEVTVQPWLLLINHSGVNLQIFTADNLVDINTPDSSNAAHFDSGAWHMPGAGERLIRIGITHKDSIIWSPPLLVHNSVFTAQASDGVPPSAKSETITLIASGAKARLGRAGAIALDSEASGLSSGAAEAVVCLTSASPLAAVALKVGRLVCGLAVRLVVPKTGGQGVAKLLVEPLIRVRNSMEQALLCKPIAAPVLGVTKELPTTPVEALEAEILTLPASDALSPVLFWNNSHPDVVVQGVGSEGIRFAHLLVLRSHLGVFWSRSFLLDGVLSTDGVRPISSPRSPQPRLYHVSLPSLRENGDPCEYSVLLTLKNDPETGLWILDVERLPASIAAPLGVKLTNLTNSLIEARFKGPRRFHCLPVSEAVPRVHRKGGELALIPQASLDQIAGLPLSYETPKSSGSSKFLSTKDTTLLLQSKGFEIAVKLCDCSKNKLAFTLAGELIYIQRVVSEDLPFCAEYLILPEGNQLFEPPKPSVERPLKISIYIDTTLVFVRVCTSLLKPGTAGSGNFLCAFVRCLEGAYSKQRASEFSLTSSLIQIDNLAQIGIPRFEFPVLLRSVLSQAAGEGKSSGVFSCSGQILHLPSGDVLLDTLDLRLPSLEAYLEDSALYLLTACGQDLLSSWVVNRPRQRHHTPLKLVSLRELVVHSLVVQLSLKAKVGVHISCKTTQFQLNRFACSNSVLKVDSLAGLLSTHYISQVLIRAGLVLGSLELIGNPACLVASFAEGVWDLVHFADTGDASSQEQLGILRGLARGLVSLVKHTTGGVCTSVTGLASSVARNLHEFSLDSEHIRHTTETRHRYRPSGLGEGLSVGLSEFALSLLGGLAGIAHHPLLAFLPSPEGPDSKEDEGDGGRRTTGAVASGLGRGLVGLVTKPLAGIADLIAFTGAGFLRRMEEGWGVTPAPNHIGGVMLSPESIQMVDGGVLDAWSQALMVRLNLPHPREYLWNGVGFDAAKSTIIWLCLPFHGSLFAVEFKVPFQSLRAGVMAVNDLAATEEDDDLPVSTIDRCELGPVAKMVLKRVLRRSRASRALPGTNADGKVVKGSPHHLDRIKAYLSSLPQSGAA